MKNKNEMLSSLVVLFIRNNNKSKFFGDDLSDYVNCLNKKSLDELDETYKRACAIENCSEIECCMDGLF